MLSSLNASIQRSMHDDNSALDGVHIRGHYTIIFGSICQLLHISLETTIRMYFRIIIRDVINASSRLNIIGPLEGARLQFEISTFAEELVKSDILLREDVMNAPATQTSPFLEMIQSHHDKLYSRLFNS